MSLPKGINFKSVKPKGYYQEFRDYYVTPVQTYSNSFSVNDIVRMQFNLQDWFMDPYESYIEAEVRLQNETPINFSQQVAYDGTNPVQFLMMDGPSTSLINDFRLEVNSKEIERIREYDQIGNLLTDLNMYPDSVDQKDYEGYFSYKNHPTSQQYEGQQQLMIPSQIGATVNTYFAASGGTSCPVIGSRAWSSGATSEPRMNFRSAFTPLGIAGNASVNLNSLSLLTVESLAPAAYTGVRAEGQNGSQFIFGSTEAQIGGGLYSIVYNPGQYMGQLTSGNTNYGIQQDNSKTHYGNMYAVNSPKLNQIDGHNIFLTNLPTSKILNGQFLQEIYTQPENTQQSRAYMQIPLLSGVMGVLIPQDRWQLIPTSSLGNCNMEFRFNQNAFFSHNGSQPKWIVTKFQLKLRLYRFDQQIQSQLKQQISQGIQLHSQIFSLGPIYNIQPNVSVTNNWQINNGIPSIKQLFFWFLSNDYEQYYYARKNFKLSQNITSMQLKIGSSYLPQNPITGHSGNIIINSAIPVDNSLFLSELHSAMNILFDCKRHININKLNFAINQRPYQVDTAVMLGNTFDPGSKKRQMLLDGGYTLWNEMRCRGKAVYAFNLDSDKNNDDTMTGIDTTKVRPIELILKSTDTNTYPNASTMYVMFLSDFIVSFGSDDTSTEGQG